MKVDYATYCHHKDADRLHEDFNSHLDSHRFKFDKIHVIYQRVKQRPTITANKHEIKAEDYPKILRANGINPNNKEADEYTHGWDSPHYWKHHCVNHLTALEKSEADYIVLSDADCHMINGRGSWVNAGIRILQQNKEALVVSPSDGSNQIRTQTMSQQLFLCHRQRLKEIDFDLPFKGFTEGGAMQEYYFMLEGRIGRYMEKHNLYRYILSDEFRYWHKQWH